MGVVWKSAIAVAVDQSPFEMNMITDWPATDFNRTLVAIETPKVTFEIHGSGFRFDAFGFFDAGRVTKIVEIVDGRKLGAITGIDLSIKEALKVFQNPVNLVPEYLEKHLAGNDSFIGSSGDDFLAGYSGNDLINGRRGNDGLMGGAGSDMFIFARGYGHDEIVDLDTKGKNHDFVDLSGLPEIKNFANFTSHLHHDQAGLHLQIGEDSLTFDDMHPRDFNKEAFIFA